MAFSLPSRKRRLVDEIDLDDVLTKGFKIVESNDRIGGLVAASAEGPHYNFADLSDEEFEAHTRKVIKEATEAGLPETG